MTNEEYLKLAAWFGSYIKTFYRDGVLPGPLEFKRIHSARVGVNAARIAAGLRLEAREAALARAAGLLHDVGRFTQYARFGTFRDEESLDHGAESRRILEAEAAKLSGNGPGFLRLLAAVEYHNRKQEDLPSGLPPGEDSLLKLVRDADKIDIMESLVVSVEEDGFRSLHAMVPFIKLEKTLTPGVLEAVARGETLSIKNLFTLADIMVMAAGWFYDLNFGPARGVAAERGFLERLQRQLPSEPRLAGFFSDLERAAAAPGAEYRL